jgi:nucleotide-binding universal stress UspA family protein
MFKKILVAVDGSESSIIALDYAAHIASQEKAELKIISAAEPLPPFVGETEDLAPTYIPIYQEALHKALLETQKRQMNRLSEEYPELQVSSEVRDGRAAHIIKEASKYTDLIVIGHRGQGGVLSWLLGSVAKQVVDGCTVPVLVVKNPDYCPD